MEQPPEHLQVLAGGQDLVHSGVLTRQTDTAAHLAGLARHVMASDAGTAAVEPDQGAQDAHGRRLARAVRAEQTEDGAAGHRQIEAVQGGLAAVVLTQTPGEDGELR